MLEIDLKSEEYREYIYPNGATLRIDSPIRLYVKENGSQRVTAENGLTYRPSTDFVGIAWKPRKGEPAFVA